MRDKDNDSVDNVVGNDVKIMLCYVLVQARNDCLHRCKLHGQ